FLEREGVVEVDVSEERLGRIGARLEKRLAGASGDEIVAALVGEATGGAKVGASLVGRSDREGTGHAVVRREGFAVAVGRGVGAGGEGDAVVPLARLVRREVRAPYGAGGGGGLR